MPLPREAGRRTVLHGPRFLVGHNAIMPFASRKPAIVLFGARPWTDAHSWSDAPAL